MFLVASLHLAFRHFGTRETLGCNRVDKSRVQKVKLRHSSANSIRSGETPLTLVETRVRRELGRCDDLRVRQNRLYGHVEVTTCYISCGIKMN